MAEGRQQCGPLRLKPKNAVSRQPGIARQKKPSSPTRHGARTLSPGKKGKKSPFPGNIQKNWYTYVVRQIVS
jgi:hypothetical protein